MRTNTVDTDLEARLLPARHEALRHLDKGGVRTRNRSLLLRRIWSQGSTSRADLARDSGMSRSATSALVEELLDVGLVEETGRGASRGGRRPTMLRFVDDAFGIIGVDLGATHIGVVLTDLHGHMKAWREQQIATRDAPGPALDAVRALVAGVIAEAGMSPEQVLGTGLAVASPVDPDRPGRLPPLFMPAWRDIDLHADLDLPGAAPLLIDNDANLGALAESWWGAGEPGEDLAFIKLGTGIGAGFVIDGHVFRGQGGMAGEIGHLVIDPHGPKCVCGLSGCLVTFVGTQALLADARLRRAGRSESLLPTDGLDLGALIDAVGHGDPLSRQIVADAAERLGVALSGLINLMNPGVVVIGGELGRVGDPLLAPLRAAVQQRCVWQAAADARIVAGALGEREVALGAATRVLQWALVRPERFPVRWRA